MTKIVFSSDQLPAELGDRKRYQLWRDLYISQFGDVDIDWHGEGLFRASSQFIPLGDLTVSSFDFTFNRVRRTKDHVGKDARDDILIGFTKGGRVNANLHGREVTAPPGSVLFYANSRPADFHSEAGVGGLSLVLPRTVLARCIPDLDGLIGSLLDPQKPAVRLLGQYLEFLMKTDIGYEAPDVRQHVQKTLLDLTVLALGAEGDTAQTAQMRGLRAARLREAVAAIQRGFSDPAFSTDHVATSLGLSRRYINELLHESGASFTDRVLEMRLQKARTMLLDARNDRLKVSDIAFACGFNEVSYFNRRFRARFGCSPTQYRGGNGI